MAGHKLLARPKAIDGKEKDADIYISEIALSTAFHETSHTPAS